MRRLFLTITMIVLTSLVLSACGGVKSSGTTPIVATGGKAVFTKAGCGSCHTLKSAGTTRTRGPNLDDLKPSNAAAVDRVTHGGGGMPSFGEQLSTEQIKAVAQLVSK